MDKDFFLKPSDPMQRRYEALRAYFVEKLAVDQVAKRLGLSVHTIYSLLKMYKKIKLPQFFIPLKRGPKDHRLGTLEIKEEIISLRKRNYSIHEIQESLARKGKDCSAKTIHFILKEEGFSKLFRRTKVELLEALQSRREYPEEADVHEFAKINHATTSFGGIFLFIPLLLEMGFEKLLSKINFYGSKQIPRINYFLSYLALKLLGKERLSHIDDFSFDYGLGVFAGLNVLPKNASLTQYSYRHSGRLVQNFCQEVMGVLYEKGKLKGQCIGLDFHSIPHYGDESQLEKNWIPTRGKSMKSVLSFFAQDLETTYLFYSHGDILRSESRDEVMRFVESYRKATNRYPQLLVFDSKLTTYEKLSELNDKKIKFITVRMRGPYVNKIIQRVKEWKRIKLDNVKRKYRDLKVYSEQIKLQDYEGKIRQLIVLGTSREFPLVLITNDLESKDKDIMTTYSHRWRVENNIQENVDFFNLNALSSPVVVKVDFDIIMTLVSNTLYKLMAEELRRFDKAKPKRIFRNFVESRVDIKIYNDKVEVIFPKQSYNPLLIDWIDKGRQDVIVTWWGGRKLHFTF